MDFLKKFKDLFSMIFDFILAVVKGEFPELDAVLGKKEEADAPVEG